MGTSYLLEWWLDTVDHCFFTGALGAMHGFVQNRLKVVLKDLLRSRGH